MIDLQGQKIGLVTVLYDEPRRSAHYGKRRWCAICECGSVRFLEGGNLLRHPPRSHRFCHRGLDNVRTEAYEAHKGGEDIGEVRLG